MNEVLKKYKDDPEMLLKLLATIFGEAVTRYNQLCNAEYNSYFHQGQKDIFRSIHDYFNLEFLEENFDWLFYKYGKKVLNDEE